uniref:Tyrosine--tRNA ligase n=1 Tax=uncultured bacterium 259 TaxID=698386 RepID=E3T6Q8_9BACT|nr:putative tyrosyl-tRNA synthetase [uncultured bacterium 259]
MDLYSELEWRGMLYDGTEGVREALAAGPITGYIGFDPTASSLHVGSLLTIMGLARLQRAGHSPIAIVGGGTGLIGDPSGKTQERTLLSSEQVEANVQGIRAQLARFLDFDRPGNPARIVNNADWLVPMDLMSFLRDVGKHFTVNYMIAKDSVKRRLESEDGISFTEFSYLLMQSYDVVMLFDRYQCTLQMGGSDQWGNITAGIDLLRKLRGAKGHGLVWPLMTTSAGVKFGKTEAGTVWLDAALTSPFRFYQFWLNTDDRDAIRYLKLFTFLDRDAIDALAAAVAQHPERREAQRALARAVTTAVHGDDHVQRAERAAEVLFAENIADANVDDVLMVFEDAPSSDLFLPAEGMPLAEMLATVKLVPSKSEAMRLLKSGGVYVNNVRATDERARLTAADAIGGALFVLRKGRKDHHIVRVRS